MKSLASESKPLQSCSKVKIPRSQAGRTAGAFQWEEQLGHSSGKNSWGIPVGRTAGAFQWEEQLGHSSGKNGWGIPVGRTAGAFHFEEPFLTDSNFELFMYLIQGIRFGS